MTAENTMPVGPTGPYISPSCYASAYLPSNIVKAKKKEGKKNQKTKNKKQKPKKGGKTGKKEKPLISSFSISQSPSSTSVTMLIPLH